MRFIYFIVIFLMFECYQSECPCEDTEPTTPLIDIRGKFISSNTLSDTESRRVIPSKSRCHCSGEKRRNITKTPCLPITILNEKVFFVSYFKASYFNSMKFCCEHGMRLVSIMNQQENDVLKNLITSHSEKYALWTSGNRLGNGRTFTWGDGTIVNFTKWWTGEPNNLQAHEECIEIYSTATGTATWNDAKCSSEKYFICEKPLYE